MINSLWLEGFASIFVVDGARNFQRELVAVTVLEKDGRSFDAGLTSPDGGARLAWPFQSFVSLQHLSDKYEVQQLAIVASKAFILFFTAFNSEGEFNCVYSLPSASVVCV